MARRRGPESSGGAGCYYVVVLGLLVSGFLIGYLNTGSYEAPAGAGAPAGSPARKAFDPTKKEAYDFIFAFLREMEQLFLSEDYNGRINPYAGLPTQGPGAGTTGGVDSSLVLHIGTDENPSECYTWKNSTIPAGQPKLPSAAQLFSNFVATVADFASHNLTHRPAVTMWDESGAGQEV